MTCHNTEAGFLTGWLLCLSPNSEVTASETPPFPHLGWNGGEINQWHSRYYLLMSYLHSWPTATLQNADTAIKNTVSSSRKFSFYMINELNSANFAARRYA